MKIELEEIQIKRILSALEEAARFYGLARVTAFKAGDIKSYTSFLTQKTEVMLAHSTLSKAYRKVVDADE